MKVILWAIILIAIALFALGQWSQRGRTPGLTERGTLRGVGRKPNVVCSEPGTPEDRLVAALPGTRDAVRQALIETGGTITAEADDYIAATYVSPLLRFVDDVEVRRDGALWQIRSASRVGHSDMGANAKRVARIRAALG